MSTVIVSGADSSYFTYLRDLVRSLDAVERPYDLGVLDGGLDPAQRTWLEARGATLATPVWSAELPERRADATVSDLQAARPFLRDYFPGYDRYVWLDADVWLQQADGLDPFLDPDNGPMVVVPEVDRSYWSTFSPAYVQNRRNDFAAYFGDGVADALATTPCINSGAFALDANAEHWRVWAEAMAFLFTRNQGFFVEQFALNAALYGRRLPARMLPARYNWVCSQSVPAFDAEACLLTEPEPPYSPLALVHLTGVTKSSPLAVRVRGEAARNLSLRYDDIRVERAPLST